MLTAATGDGAPRPGTLQGVVEVDETYWAREPAENRPPGLQQGVLSSPPSGMAKASAIRMDESDFDRATFMAIRSSVEPEAQLHRWANSYREMKAISTIGMSSTASRMDTSAQSPRRLLKRWMLNPSGS